MNSGGGSSIVNWRDWRSSSISHNKINLNHGLYTSVLRSPGSGSVPRLVDLCAKYVAANLPFELVEAFKEPVPEDLQLTILRSSFPDNIENIRLYSCLANGSVDEYLRGEQLYQSKCVKKVMQIGFHLSAQASQKAHIVLFM